MPTTIMIVNTSEDIVALLRDLLVGEGYGVAAGFVPDFRRGHADLSAFVAEHEPAAILWDIALPYEENWAYFQAALAGGALRGRPVVLTTTNKRALEGWVGPTPAFELIGKPYDLDRLLAAIRRAAVPAAS